MTVEIEGIGMLTNPVVEEVFGDEQKLRKEHKREFIYESSNFTISRFKL